MCRKPFKTIDQLVDLLYGRGLICKDREELRLFLHNINYYRFSGYAREFQKDPAFGDNNFVRDTDFSRIHELIELDSQLRQLLLEQLSIVEIAIRARYAHELGHVYGSDAFYLDLNNYEVINDKPGVTIKGILQDLQRSRSRMIRHYRKTEENPGIEDIRVYQDVPIWVAVEVLSFGRIANMLTYLKNNEPAKRVAESMNVQWSPFTEVIHSLSVLRNLCAYHQQLWNRFLDIRCPVQKKLRPRSVSFTPGSIYTAIIMLNYYREKIDGDRFNALKINDLLSQSKQFMEGICCPKTK